MLEDKEGPFINLKLYFSGESGSGRTKTAKITTQYLETQGCDNGVGDKILQKNLILESFCNAETLKNDKSNRFVSCNPFKSHI